MKDHLIKTAVKDALKELSLFNVASFFLRQQRKINFQLRDKKVIGAYLGSHKVRKLQVGAGKSPLRGWLNSDISPSVRDVIYLDATRPFPFGDCVFDYLFSEHMIEHVNYTDGLHIFGECHRVLKPGGKVRIVTPDLRFLIELYQQDKTPLQRAYIEWATDEHVRGTDSYEDTFVINNFVRDWGHSFIYDERVLRHALEWVGFTDIVRRELNKSEDAELRGLENEARMPDGFLSLESLALEATKPGSEVGRPYREDGEVR